MPIDKLMFLEKEIVDSIPFADDVLENRQNFADNLTSIISNVGDGCVMSIDAPWGEGKSTFVDWWEKDLSNNGYAAIKLNAFEHDFQGDAFTAIFPTLTKLFRDNKTVWENFKYDSVSSLKDKFEAIIKKGMPILAGGLATVSTSNPIIGKSVGDFAKTVTQVILSDDTPLTLHKQLLDFKNELNDFTTKIFNDNMGKPFIFIIDELDRCRPDFAVEMLEKIKHFFSVPGIIWILAINKDQLSDSIRHIYGNEEPHLYFEKFINIQTLLPKDLDIPIKNIKNRGHYYKILTSFTDVKDDELIHFVSIIFEHFNLSIRDVKKYLLYLKILETSEDNNLLIHLLIPLYIKRPDIYSQIKYKTFDGATFLEENFSWLKEFESNTLVTEIKGFLYFLHIKSFENRILKFKELQKNTNGNKSGWLPFGSKLAQKNRDYKGTFRFINFEKDLNMISTFSL